MTFSEMNKEVKLSIGLLITIVGATFFVTQFYISQTTLEERQQKQNDRHVKEQKRLEERINQIEQILINTKNEKND